MVFTATIELSEDLVDGLEYGDYPIEVEYEATSYIPACTSGPADSWHPAEGGDIEILSAELPDGRELFDVYLGDTAALDKELIRQIEEQGRVN